MRQFRRHAFNVTLLASAGAALSACSSIQPQYAARPSTVYPTAQAPQASGQGGVYKVGKPYQINGQWYYPAEQPDYDETGLASWYGDAFNGKPTANGEVFDMNALSAAHKTLPLPSMVEVTNLDNGRSMQLRVNDRGPFVENRIIDLSRGAADQLGVLRPGLARVRVRYVGPGGLQVPSQDGVQLASLTPPAATVAMAPESEVAAAPAQSAITQSELPPLAEPTVVASDDAPLAVTQTAAATAPTYQVQAGAFSNLSNAQNVATRLADTGVVEIQTVEREGGPLYRVMVRSITDEAQATLVRDKVVEIGIADARIINPF